MGGKGGMERRNNNYQNRYDPGADITAPHYSAKDAYFNSKAKREVEAATNPSASFRKQEANRKYADSRSRSLSDSRSDKKTRNRNAGAGPVTGGGHASTGWDKKSKQEQWLGPEAGREKVE